MPSVDNFVQRFEEAWRDPVSKFVELFAPEGTLLQSGMDKPLTRDEIPAHQARTSTLLPDISVRVSRSAINGSDVFIEWESTGTFLGRRVNWGGASRFTLLDGLIVEEVAYFDTLPLRALVDPRINGGDIASAAVAAVAAVEQRQGGGNS